MADLPLRRSHTTTRIIEVQIRLRLIAEGVGGEYDAKGVGGDSKYAGGDLNDHIAMQRRAMAAPPSRTMDHPCRRRGHLGRSRRRGHHHREWRLGARLLQVRLATDLHRATSLPIGKF